MYEVLISIPVRIKIEGDFEGVVSEATEIGAKLQTALAERLKDADYIEVLSPNVISAVDPYLLKQFQAAKFTAK